MIETTANTNCHNASGPSPKEVYSQWSPSGHLALRKRDCPDSPGTGGPKVQVELRAVPQACLSRDLLLPFCPSASLRTTASGVQSRATTGNPCFSFHQITCLKTCYSVWRAKLVSIFMATENLKGGLFHLC